MKKEYEIFCVGNLNDHGCTTFVGTYKIEYNTIVINARKAFSMQSESLFKWRRVPREWGGNLKIRFGNPIVLPVRQCKMIKEFSGSITTQDF
jgi:hypothetical protein